MIRFALLLFLLFTSCNSSKTRQADDDKLENNSSITKKNQSIVKNSPLVFSDTLIVRYHDSFNDSVYYNTDTILTNGSRNRNLFLTGTTILPSTGNQLDARKFNIFLDDLKQSDCTHDRGRYKNNISSINKDGDKVTIVAKLSANCCYQFLGDIGVANDSTLNLISTEYGENHCACHCIYDLTYSLSTNYYDEKGITGLKGFVINNDLSTFRKF